MLQLLTCWFGLACTIGDPHHVPSLGAFFGRAPDSAVVAASDAMARGQPWRASRLLVPVVRDSARRSPDAIMLAAEAASAWGGWPEVERLLGGQPWIDARFGGRARLLLTRAALELREDTAAVAHGVAAVKSALDKRARAERQVLLARAYDRLDQRDSASALYAAAAAELPLVADWIRLRAAGVTDDSARRVAFYAGLGALAKTRVEWTEALARQRAGDTLSAIRHYTELGATATALRLRVPYTRNTPSRDSVRRDLLKLLETRGGSVGAREAMDLLDSSFAPLSAREQLAAARSASVSGPLDRAATGYARALAAGLGDPTDRFGYASVLFRLGRYKDAATQYARIRAPKALAAAAAYQRGRALVRDGNLKSGRAELRSIPRRWPKDTSAAIALYLLADLATDERRDDDARSAWRRVAHEFPKYRLAPGSAFRAAIVAFAHGKPRVAALELDSLVKRYRTSDEVTAAIYWSGRAYAAAGDSATARLRWQDAAARDQLSYYAAAASQRLGVAPWAPPAATDTFIPIPDLDSALARAGQLERLGMQVEARFEYDDIIRAADGSTERLLAAADALRKQERTVSSIALAWRALGRGAIRDARLYRLLYPVIHADALAAEAADRKMDPSFVAGLIRQESMFNPDATSGAGARGLMQLMPEVGEGVAKSLAFPVWDPVLLYQPDVNLQLGVVHVAELMARYREPVEVLAAYNAGAQRVDRWAAKVGMSDPELFAERIPFVETRDYVRIVQRNQALYRALYQWKRP